MSDVGLAGAVASAGVASARASVGVSSGPLPLRAMLAYPAAALSGALYFAAFPGIDLWPLAFFALVPLIIALRGQAPRRALGLGWTAGFSMTMLGFYWLVEMLETFSGFPTALCVLFMAILCAYQAGRIALLGWLTARAEQRGWPGWLAFGLAFPTSELVFPLLFPWYYAATVHQVPALLQWAEWGGPIAVGLALVGANLALALGLVALLERRRPAWRVLGALAAVPLLALLYGLLRIPMVDASVKKAETARVVLVQANMSLMGKRLRPDEALVRHLALTRGAMQEKPADLVVWSETSIGGAVDERYANSHYQQNVGSQLAVPTIFGAVLRREVNDARKYALSNSALVTDRAGKVVGRYDKQFLLGFGEYLPLGETFPILYEWSPNSGHFSPGNSFKPLPVGKHEAATFICYEDIIPAFVNRIMNNGDPELLVNLTNDAWFGDTTQPWIHLALSKLRAIEQRRYFVRSTNSGVSAFIDPVGRTLAYTPTFSEIAIAQDLRWLKLTSPYRWLGDVPWWLVALASFALAFVRSGSQRARPSRPSRRPSRPASRPPPPAEPLAAAALLSVPELVALEPIAQQPKLPEPAPQAKVPEPAAPTPPQPTTETPLLAPEAPGPGRPSLAGLAERPSLPQRPTLDPKEFGAFPKPPTTGSDPDLGS